MTPNNPKLTALWMIANADSSDSKSAKAQAVRIVSKALSESDGDISCTARALGIGRSTLNRWIEKYPEIKAILDRIKEETRQEMGR